LLKDTIMNSQVTGSLLIGLTGGIASGKSTVLQYLRQAGYSVIDADKLGHKVLEQGNPGYNKVVKCFGNEILNPDGSVNRTALGGIVFVNAEKLKQLNEISHPIIAEMIQKEFEESVGQAVRSFLYDLDFMLMEEQHSSSGLNYSRIQTNATIEWVNPV